MGMVVMVMGSSGSGKSYSLRNFSEGEVGIFNVANKPLPFRKSLTKVNSANYEVINKCFQNPKLKAYVIDDSQYLMTFEMFKRAKELGYNKFTDIALHFYELLDQIVMRMPEDVIVYFLHHTERGEDGRVKAKTLGKMLDNQLTVEGLFSIVLLAKSDGKRYYFETQTDGETSVKSPPGMFEREIDNDLKAVDTAIREYYGMNQKEKKA